MMHAHVFSKLSVRACLDSVQPRGTGPVGTERGSSWLLVPFPSKKPRLGPSRILGLAS